MVSLPLEGDEFASNKALRYYKRFKNYIIATGGVIVILIILSLTGLLGELKIALQPLNDDSVCPLAEPIFPKSFQKDNSTVLEILYGEDFKLKSVEKLGKAIQVDTQVFDNQPEVEKDPKVWKKFEKFHQYLNETFPTVFETTELTYVNTYGIVLHWKGANQRLKPVMLTAHQDVVPVPEATLKNWNYPPFSGFYDGTFVWGRGASDCKNVLVGIMETLELLIKQDFQPQRSIIAAFGFDEEASGYIGARALGKYLEDKFGHESMFAIIDEGMSLQTDELSGRIVAAIATGEKGYADIKVSLKTPGGHSSVPPDHTSIGIMSELARVIENDPFEPIFTEKNPMMGYMQCLATHSDNNIPKYLRKSILRASFDKLANSKVVKFLTANRATKYNIQTSQAIDMVNGGQKANALPEYVEMVVNHRIAIESNLKETSDHFKDRVSKIAEQYDLGLTVFGEELREQSANGQLVVDFFSQPLEPAPISPTDNNSWKYFTGVIKHLYEKVVFPDLDYPIITAPAIMSGNTDTRYYWNLTKNIYRFSPFFTENVMFENNIHRVNEKVKASAHLQLIAFFYQYLKTIDERD